MINNVLQYLITLIRDNIAWLLITFIFLILFNICSAFRLFFILIRSKKEIFNNHEMILAKRFLDLYINKNNRASGEPFYFACCAISSIKNVFGPNDLNTNGKIDKKLNQLKLIVIDGEKIMFSNKIHHKIKNYIIFQLTKYFLIIFLGHSKNLYKVK